MIVRIVILVKLKTFLPVRPDPSSSLCYPQDARIVGVEGLKVSGKIKLL